MVYLEKVGKNNLIKIQNIPYFNFLYLDFKTKIDGLNTCYEIPWDTWQKQCFVLILLSATKDYTLQDWCSGLLSGRKDDG